MKKTESLLRWVSIVLFTILAAFVTVPTLGMIQNAALRSMNPFTFWLCMMFLLWFIVVRFLFQDFYERGQLYGGVKNFYLSVLDHPLHSLYGVATRGMYSLNSRLVLLGLLILSLCGLLAITGMLDNLAMNYMAAPFLRRAQPRSSESHTSVVWLATPDNSKSQYLESLLTLAGDLKESGARAVIFNLPVVPQTEKNTKLIRAIQETGIAVFSVRLNDPFYGIYDRPIVSKPVSPKLNISWGYYSLVPDRTPGKYAGFVDRFFPFKTRDFLTNEIVPDVGLVAAQKFRGEALSESNGGDIMIGAWKLPIASDGSLYSYHPRGSRVRRGIMVKVRETNPTELVYTFSSSKDLKVTTSTTLMGFEEFVKDRVVITNWLDEGALTSQTWDESIAYPNFIDNILDGEFLLRKAEGWPFYLTLVSVLLCGIIVRYLRGLFAVPLMLLFGAGLFLGSNWLLQHQDVLLDVSYPLAAVILSIAILPLARFSFFMQAAREPSLGVGTGFFPSVSPQLAMLTVPEKKVVRQEKTDEHLSLPKRPTFAELQDRVPVDPNVRMQSTFAAMSIDRFNAQPAEFRLALAASIGFILLVGSLFLGSQMVGQQQPPNEPPAISLPLD